MTPAIERETFANFITRASALPCVASVSESGLTAGFRVQTHNRYIISVQCGMGNYCDHYGNNDLFDEHLALLKSGDRVAFGKWCHRLLGGTTTAEIAFGPMIGTGFAMTEFPDYGDTVKGHVPLADVLTFIEQVGSFDTVELPG